MMSYLPLMANAASPLSTWPLPIPLSSHYTQQEVLMTRIQMEIEINKAVALGQQHQINGLVKLITTAQMERDDAKQKCLQIQNHILLLLLLQHQNDLSLSTTDTCDASTRLSFTATDVSSWSMSSLSTALNDAAHQAGEVIGFENAACLLDQPSICRPPFDELMTHNTCLSGNNPSIDDCSDFIISDKNNHGLASFQGFEIDEQELQQRRNMGDGQHEGEMKLCGSITKPCRVLPSYTLEESIEQCNQIPIPAIWCSQDPMACMTTTMMRRGPLSQRGRLVESVIEAGPLLKDLLLAVSLPNWRNPPPPINCNEIPIPIFPFIIPSFHTTHPPPINCNEIPIPILL